jgi:hypothetical protein
MAAVAAPSRATNAKAQIIRRFFMRDPPVRFVEKSAPFELARAWAHECELPHVSHSLDAERDRLRSFICWSANALARSLWLRLGIAIWNAGTVLLIVRCEMLARDAGVPIDKTAAN